MSSNKEVRQQRRKHSQRVIRNQVGIYHHYNDQSAVLKVTGKFRKLKALNCGQARCQMCANPRRTRGELTLAERRANEAFKAQLND